jgi:hypothetical protein
MIFLADLATSPGLVSRLKSERLAYIRMKSSQAKHSHPAAASYSVEHTENGTINIAATIFLHIAFIIHAMNGPPQDYARTPASFTAQADGATTAEQSFFPP